MNDLMIDALNKMFLYGNFGVIINGCSYVLHINDTHDLEVVISSSTSKRKTIDEDAVNKLLSFIAYQTFFIAHIENVLDISLKVDENENSLKNDRLIAINRMFKFFMGLLDINNSKLLNALISDGGSLELWKEMNFDYSSKILYDYDYIIQTISRQIVKFATQLKIGYDIYQGMKNAKTEADYEEYKRKWSIFISRNSKKDVISVYQPTCLIDTSKLVKNGIPYDIVNEKEFLSNPAEGRDKEIRQVGSILLTPSYSAILLGQPGVGKSAIVDGLVYKIQRHEVSGNLDNKIIIKITPNGLVSGCVYRGEFEKKVEVLIEFLKSHKEVVLYVDELHSGVGVGTSGKGKNDLLNILKPHIENGSIKMIGATTDTEYQEVLQQDRAFTSRFKSVIVKEPDVDILRRIIDANIYKYEMLTCIKFATSEEEKERFISVLIELTNSKNYNFKDVKYNPRLVLSIVESAFGLSSFDGSSTVSSNYLIEAIEGCDNIYNFARQKAISELKRQDSMPEEQSKLLDFIEYKKSKSFD